MAIAEKEDILANAIHLKIGVVFHYIKVQSNHKFCAAERTTRVAALCRMNHAYYIAPNLCSYLFEIGNVHLKIKVVANVIISQKLRRENLKLILRDVNCMWIE